jgi:hypothetical protein
MKRFILLIELFKTGQITPMRFSDRGFATVPPVLLRQPRSCYSTDGFVFFILVESLKNHSKSQKNHKIENLILLDST